MLRKNKCINKAQEALNFDLSSLVDRREPGSILMCDPTYFEVKDVKNLFMEGNVNKTNRELAFKQWQDLKAQFEEAGYKVDVIAAQPGLEDMVFTANQVLLGEGEKGPYVVLSRMVHESRRKEVPYFLKWFQSRGYHILDLVASNDDNLAFEGQGDALWHPGKQLLYGGYGHRTSKEAYSLISDLLDIPVVLLHLIHPRFYHLDTAFCPLNQEAVMVYPDAFEEHSLQLIKRYFQNVITASAEEAENFALNALALGKNIFIQKGSHETTRQLSQLGFSTVEVDTSEFMKSGGSVSCLKMMTYESANRP